MKDLKLTLYALAVGILVGSSTYHLSHWLGEYRVVMKEVRKMECNKEGR